MGFKENLKKYRLEKSMTLEELANIIGVSRQTVQKYESGIISNIPFDKIEKLSKALNIPPNILMGWDNGGVIMNKLPFINDTIKSQKQKLKLNQTEFANLIGKSLSTVKKYDIGYPIPEETLIKICDILKIDFLPLLYYQSLSQNESYQNLILKYSNKIREFENKNNESELFKIAEELKKLYKNFYDRNYNNDTNIIKFDGTKKELNYKIIDNRIFIIETSVPLLRTDENIKNQEINNFTLEEGKNFIIEFKEYFNFKNDMYKKRKSTITLTDILKRQYK